MRRRYDADEPEYVTERSGSGLLEKILLIGAVGVVAWPAVKGIARHWRRRHPVAAREQAIDESLEQTFPASDPPATRFVDVPSNRH